jgi:hypothetical protein
MNNRYVTSALVGLLFLSTFVSAALIYKYNASMRTLQRLQSQLAGPDYAQKVMNAILLDTSEYARTTKSQEAERIVQFATGGKVPTPLKAPAK